MATKTLSVDLEAYERLRQAKASVKESFSAVIKRATWPPTQGTAGRLAAWASARGVEDRLSDAALDELDRHQETDEPAPDRWIDG